MKQLFTRPLTYRFFNATMVIIVVNLLVHFLVFLAGRDLLSLLAMNPQAVVRGGRFWQLFTYMFVHSPGNLSHILFNMLAVFFFGSMVERRIGSGEFLILYFFTGLGAGILSLAFYLLTGQTYVWLLGASGAVYGVLLAYATLFPRSHIYIMGIIPVRAPILVLIYLAMEIFSQVSGRESGVAHLAHLAGFLFAYLYLRIRLRISPWQAFFR